jgi:acyl-CoA synthetase (AMP-forming)/AMP-acid ligase II
VTRPALRLISDYAAWWAAERPEAEAVVLGELRWSYAEMSRRVDEAARALMAAGVARGDRVATLSTPHPDYFVTFLATCSIGAIWVGLNPRYTLRELAYVVGDAEPSVIFARAHLGDRDYRDDLEALRNEYPSVRRLVILRGDPLPTGGETFEAFLAGAAKVSDADLMARRRATEPADAALIVYTSGTTGQPKGAMVPHRGLVTCSLVQQGVWVVDPLRILNNLPINHIGCVGDISSFALVGGGTMVFMESFEPATIPAVIERERLTCWGQVPAMFAMTLQAAGPGDGPAGGADLSSLQLIVWSGSAAPRDLIAALARICPRLSSSYGLTESVGSLTYAAGTSDLDILADTIGWPSPAYEFRIARPDGTEASVGEAGEIQTRGSHIMLGYWRRPEATREAIDSDGWLHTGDLAVRRPDGAIALVGRLKEMFKSGGYNVYPREIEIVLESHPAVQLAAVLGVPDPVYAEVGHAFVMVGQGANITEEMLREHCKSRLANYKVPKRFTIRSDLPLLPIGKIDKQGLRAGMDGRGRE